MKGYLSIKEIADKYGISDSAARTRMKEYTGETKSVKSNRHVSVYYPNAAVRTTLGKVPRAAAT
jgi:ribosomal protein S25